MIGIDFWDRCFFSTVRERSFCEGRPEIQTLLSGHIRTWIMPDVEGGSRKMHDVQGMLSLFQNT